MKEAQCYGRECEGYSIECGIGAGVGGAMVLTEVMVLSAVSAPILKSEPGTLLETVAGMTTMGMHSSSNFSLACTSSRPPTYACVGERERGRGRQG